MPKKIKQKYNKLENNDNSNSILKPTFPPTLIANDLIKNAIKSNKPNKSRAITFPNAFIAYRMALTKEYRNKNITLPRMGQLSKLAKNSWEEESKDVKEFYNKLAEDAKSLGGAESVYVYQDTEVNTVKQNSSSEHFPKDSSPNYSFYEDPYGQNSSDRELLYILDFHFTINPHD
ncbi:16216_t:CDS:2 [Funneliformis mosseae]|uniref:16216_t:CDS:1 n=1 Tax=Funneliformis mosseae TaxID=27381 RepID=A0A9N9HH96_FUNMO|nr:16216_t:CDS:2 [Funneliformis mosseae]